jgi:hypothetical protein
MTVFADGGIGEGLPPTTEKNEVLFYSTESGALDQSIGFVYHSHRPPSVSYLV